MTARWIRRGVLAICILGIAGMIVSSIAGSTGGAVTSGLITAVAVVVLIPAPPARGPSAFGSPQPVDEHAAADVERRIQTLVANGADEADVRSLVRAVRRLSPRT